jgi:DNA-binding PadR family transcriptional regulator
MAMLSYYGDDGLPYQDIKGVLGLEDGSLGPNLMWLKKQGYIKVEEAEVEDKTVAVYYMTEEGKNAYAMVSAWLDKLLHPGN